MSDELNATYALKIGELASQVQTLANQVASLTGDVKLLTASMHEGRGAMRLGKILGYIFLGFVSALTFVFGSNIWHYFSHLPVPKE
jgi:hypothetical protein